jgi:4-aminobutyrate aminotransferase-like enzyme/Ser/Thr protein kinase RdoA (MazF antagonist)
MVETVNPFAGLALPNPDVPLDEAAAIAREHFGVTGTPRALGSQQDQNVLFDDGQRRVVLKIANPGFGRGSLLLQNAAMRHVAERRPPLATPVPLPALDGADIVGAEHNGEVLDVRLLSWVDGTPMCECEHLAPPVLHSLGAAAAAMASALADFDHPEADRVLQWDVRHAEAVVAALAPGVRDPARREQVERAMAAAAPTLQRLGPALREQVIHGDASDWNVVARRAADGRPVPCGVIDFGDVTRSWLAGEAAMQAAGAVAHALHRPVQTVAASLRGFHGVVPLTPEEIEAIHALVLARLAVCAVSSDQQVELSPDNDYAHGNVEREWAMLAAYVDVPQALATAAFRLAVGLPARPAAAGRLARAAQGAGPVADGLAGRALVVVDLSPETDDLRYEEPHAPRGAARAVAAAAERGVPLARYAEARLTSAVRPSADEPSTIALGAALFLPAGTIARSPLDATVERAGEDGVTLRLEDGVFLRLSGIDSSRAPGERVGRGAALGAVREPAAEDPLPARLHVQALLELPDGPVPELAQPSLAEAWLALSPDPSPLLGTDVAATPPDDAAALAAREASVASPQIHYYAEPPQVVRGLRHWLYGADGRAYLDVVNNVAVLGHSHPAVAEAAARQLRILNTNSRFLYPSLTRYAARLAELLPDPLEVVFAVSSGSEANDLALRIARAATGHEDVLAISGAYHGWTLATFAISTHPFDNPAGHAPPWVHTVEQPNPYRGLHRGPDAAERYADDVRAHCAELLAAGRPPAAFVCEPLLGNSGGVELPAGYLASAYAAVRAAGGLCIADEVQVGLGRTGERLWAFEREGVVPDIVTIAKPTGNGHPVGAVITSRAVADAFGREASWFSSVGGSPVSCEVGLAVLDTMEREGLRENARVVGSHLRDRLAGLVERHPLAGAVHGVGLYLGLELVRDRATLEPAIEEAEALCERLRERGVIVQPTGDHMNVLKIKPPLCITLEAADFLADRIDEALTDGW